jgi:predicted nucleic-acid-binding protein
MIGIDTNVLVRYLTEDDEVQSTKAIKLIDEYTDANETIFINNIVVCELIWVLERGYKYSKDQVITVLKSILTTVGFCFEDHQILWVSATEYAGSAAGFADILIGQLNAENNCSKTFTFDQKASSLSMFTIME